MKVVLVTIFILIITFLSQQIDISIKVSDRLTASFSLMLFSLTVTADGSGSSRERRRLALPITNPVKYLLRHSYVEYSYIRGLCIEQAPVGLIFSFISSATLASIFNYYSNNFTYIENADPSGIKDIHVVNVKSHVIFLLISLTIFIYYAFIGSLRRRRKNVG